MAYSELIKDFGRIRTYLRSFYVEGFRHRGDFAQKSARAYDNERRRVESWLGDYVQTRQDADGRRVFISVDSRAMSQNPLYQAFRTKSFTSLDITLHFHVLDILRAGSLPISAIMEELVDRLYQFESDDVPDESTVRKKLKEYVALGLVRSQRQGRETLYSIAEDLVDLESWNEPLAFFSEVSPVGVVGSFVRDRLPGRFEGFRFKHHYILNALDSEVLCDVLTAIGGRRLVSFEVHKRRVTVLPLKVYVGTQTGRQYLLAWSPSNDLLAFYRVDLIDRVSLGEAHEHTVGLDARLSVFCSHVWGVAGNSRMRLQHVEMTVFVGPGEEHIVQRLEREKRCGVVDQLDEEHWRFSADVYDALEMLPWLRTFTGRVMDLRCSDERVTKRFWDDFEELARMYGGGTHAVS